MVSSQYSHPSMSQDSRRRQEPGKLSYEGQALSINSKQDKRAGVRGSRENKTRVPAIVVVVRAYERFLELPVVVVLAVLWLAGATLLGTCAWLLYLYGALLMRMLAGS